MAKVMPKEVVDKTFQIFREILENLSNRDEVDIAESLDIPLSLVKPIQNCFATIDTEEIGEAVMEELDTCEDEIIT